MFKKLGLDESKPTFTALQLVDRSISYTKGIFENVLIKFEKFFFLVDFVVLDIEEDKDKPKILGQPFLAIGDMPIIQVEVLMGIGGPRHWTSHLEDIPWKKFSYRFLKIYFIFLCERMIRKTISYNFVHTFKTSIQRERELLDYRFF